VLFDDTVNGRPRKLVGMANRNAFYYVLDRETGEFLNGTPYVKQTWANRWQTVCSNRGGIVIVCIWLVLKSREVDNPANPRSLASTIGNSKSCWQ
jgi:glucose dehydrogenase